ncbi:MAG: ABC transporter substrate-binding protein [Actinobacteria bacterium]|nr:ABC transporter substrate-binding protein [Actinomycetota bacterium]
MRPKPLAVVLLLALTGTACAGEVGRYRNTGFGQSGMNQAPAVAPATGTEDAVSGSTDTTAATVIADGTNAAGGLPVTPGTNLVTPVSGPAAPAARAAASGRPVPTSAAGAAAGIARNGPAVAEATFAEAGLINGRRIVVKYYDDGTANASTIQVEEKRAKDETFQYISLVGESNVVLAPLAEQHKIPLVIGNIDRKVALPLTYSFPVFAYWAYQASLLPGFIKNVLGGGAKKIGIVYEGTSTAIDAKNTFKDKAKEFGLNIVFEQPIAQNQSTCANEVANLQSHGVELVFMMNGPLGAICMLRDARALAYKPVWTGVGISWNFNIVSQATGGAPDGVRMLRTSPTLESPQGRHYSEIMRKGAPNSGADTDDLLLAFYSVLQSVIEGLRRAGPDLTREGLVRTWETKMNGYDSGYLPPPTFGPGMRSGPLVVGISACCTNNQWTTPQQGWRADF